MTHIANKILDLNSHMTSLIDEFECYIKDKSIPLEQRWNCFINAPSEMKNHSLYGGTFNSIPKYTVGYDMPINFERYQTRDTKDMVEQYHEHVLCANDYTFPDLQCWEITTVATFIEEILEMNLGSYTYDW